MMAQLKYLKRRNSNSEETRKTEDKIRWKYFEYTEYKKKINNNNKKKLLTQIIRGLVPAGCNNIK